MKDDLFFLCFVFKYCNLVANKRLHSLLTLKSTKIGNFRKHF